MDHAAYRARVAAEVGNYESCLSVHDLPPIFHYWSDKYARPKLAAFGFQNADEMFHGYFRERCERRENGARFLSIGSGNCDQEIRLAARLRGEGYTGFVIDCVDLNPSMLERGVMAGGAAGVGGQIHVIQADLNEWTPAREYDAVMACQSLHHVLNLEGLFAGIKDSLEPNGCFVISDIIGRNGHERWPEALEIVHEFWRKLPPTYRFNRQLQRYEELFEDTVCSAESFEGIRSQDILPLLLDYFHFQLFVGFANIIDPFVDRSFGPNFDATAEWDRAFIDQVHQRDEHELLSGRIKPTHMLAVVGIDPDVPTLFHSPISPEFSVRPPGVTRGSAVVPDAYQPDAWPHQPGRELEMAGLLADAEDRIKSLNEELKVRTAWAQGLDKEVEKLTARALQLDKEFEERTSWALRLDEDQRRLAWAWHLDRALRRLFRAARRLLARPIPAAPHSADETDLHSRE